MRAVRLLLLAGALYVAAVAPCAAQQPGRLSADEGDFVIRDFRFGTGEVLPELRIHYRTLGKPVRGTDGKTANAVLVLHGTTGSGRGFLGQNFGGVLFGPGQLLDAEKYFIILPDGIGHGGTSKPSNGLRARFPKYDYDDMVRAQYRLLTEHLGVDRLRLIMGTSMGCMHSFVWGATYSGFMDSMLPLACLPVEIAGRNRMMRRMALDSIRTDTEWKNGEYTATPSGLKAALYILVLMGSSPLQMQKNQPSRDAADEFLANFVAQRMRTTDANDFLYAFDASRNYNPQPHLEKITAHVVFINSADDMINPPELGIAEREIRRVKNGRFILLPVTDETRGHGTHSLPRLWQHHLAELLKATER